LNIQTRVNPNPFAILGNGPPLFLFLDPARTGPGDADHAVFATGSGRVGYGDARRTVATLDARWRPWTLGTAQPNDRADTLSCIVRGSWAAAALSLSPIKYDGAKVHYTYKYIYKHIYIHIHTYIYDRPRGHAVVHRTWFLGGGRAQPFSDPIRRRKGTLYI